MSLYRSVNNFDVPRLKVHFNFDCTQTYSFCKLIIYDQLEVHKRSKSVFLFFFSVTGSDYQVLVHKVNDWCDEVSDWETLESDVYIAAQIRADSVNPSMVFVVGDGKTKDGYENKQLSEGQKYKIYSRGLGLRATKVTA